MKRDGEKLKGVSIKLTDNWNQPEPILKSPQNGFKIKRFHFKIIIIFLNCLGYPESYPGFYDPAKQG